jgi:hypothetical protein
MPRPMLPIQALLEQRCRELDLSRHDVVRRAGFVNLAKGHRRLDELLAGDLHHSRGLIERLPVALDVSAEAVHEAVTKTERQIRNAEDDAWRAGFKPHAVILTENHIPTSITFAALLSVDRQLRVDFEPGSSKITYITQALKAVRLRSPIRFYGNAVGVIINYSPDQALRFDLEGVPVEVLPAAHRGETLSFSIRGKPVSPGALAAILGIQ